VNAITETIVTIVGLIVGLAVLGLVLSPKSTAVPLAQTFFSGLGNDIGVAGAPVTGNSVSLSLAYPSTNAYGFGSAMP